MGACTRRSPPDAAAVCFFGARGSSLCTGIVSLFCITNPHVN
jgi:hypothetical protein